jgi:catalase
MFSSSLSLALLGVLGVAQAQCPFADVGSLAARAQGQSRDHLSEYEVDDSEGYLTSDVGGNIGDQESLRAGDRGSVLLEDFIFRQKITHFDHERVRTTDACVDTLPKHGH